MSEDIVNSLFEELSKIPEVEAIALGGSRAGTVYDENSDYDVYLYCVNEIFAETSCQNIGSPQILCKPPK